MFASLILADEINRTPPKTQAALLEAMEEGRVTIEGDTLDLPRPFVVCATQNPIEFEGTYQLPEAQLDRFLFKLLLGYPDPAAETEILRRYQAGLPAARARPRARRRRADHRRRPRRSRCRRRPRRWPSTTTCSATSPSVAAWLRASPDVIVGPSPRGSIALVLAAKVMAAARGADFVTPDDLQSLAPGRAAPPDRALGRRRARRAARPTT